MKTTFILLFTCLIFIFNLPCHVVGEDATVKNTKNVQNQINSNVKTTPYESIEQKINIAISELSAIKKEIKKENIFTNIIPIIVVIIAGLLALFQVKANIISSARIEWTQNLRKTLSLFLSEVMNINLNLRDIASKYNGTNKNEVGDNYIKQYDNFKKVNEYASQIKLFLNNQKESYCNLQKKIDEYVFKATKDPNFGDVKCLDDMEAEIIDLSQKILKQAWEDAKSFKLRDIFKFKI